MKNTKNFYRHSATNRPPYTPGKNVFGQDAYTELVVLKRETAFEQILAVYEAVFRCIIAYSDYPAAHQRLISSLPGNTTE